jgi:hypothetical protein
VGGQGDAFIGSPEGRQKQIGNANRRAVGTRGVGRNDADVLTETTMLAGIAGGVHRDRVPMQQKSTDRPESQNEAKLTQTPFHNVFNLAISSRYYNKMRRNNVLDRGGM